MKQLQVFARMALLLAFLLSSLVAAVGVRRVVAQAPTTSYTSQLTGEVIQTSGAWTIDMDSTAASEGTETVVALGQFDGVLIAYMPSGIDLVMARDYMLNEFSSFFDNVVPIDRGAYGNVSYSLDMASSDGIEFGMFSLFLGERPSGYVEYYLYFGPAMYFEQGFNSVQQSVTVGGKNIFDGVDASGLQSLLTANAGVTGAASNLPDDNVLGGATEAPAPTETTQTTAGTTDDGDLYISTVDAEVDGLTSQLNTFGDLFGQVASGDLSEADSAAALQQMDDIATGWSSYPEVAATVPAAAGHETIDGLYRELATNIGLMGDSWLAFVAAPDKATGETALNEMLEYQGLVSDGINEIQPLLDSALAGQASTGNGNSTAGQTSDPVPTETASGSDTGTGGTADSAEYITSMQSEMEFLQTTLNDFVINFAALQSEGNDTAATEINRVATEWVSYPDRAALIVAPAGMEDTDAAYQTLTVDVEDMGNKWLLVVDALQTGNETSIDAALNDFLAAMTSVQQEIDALNILLGDGGDTSATGTATEETIPTAVPTEVLVENTGETTGTRPDLVLGGKSGKNETETGAGGQTSQGSDATDYEALGLVSDNEYVSPQYDISLTWDDTWFFDEEFTDPITSDTASGQDTLSLTWDGGPVSIFSTISTADGVTPEDIADYWASDDYLADTASADAEVLLHEASRSGSAAVVTRDYLDDGTEVTVLRGAKCGDANCETLVVVTMIGLPDIFADSYADARSGIENDGDRVFDVFSPRDITTALDS